MKVRYLVAMTREEFEAIPAKAVPHAVQSEDPTMEGPRAIECIASAYCDTLITKNQKIQELVSKSDDRPGDTDWREGLTPGQRMLQSLTALDGQVQNGGVTKFFWNCPELVFEVSDALTTLGPAELSDLYDRALEGLVGKKDQWARLRTQSAADSSVEPFQRSYDMLDLGWFDDAYFKQVGYDDHGVFVLQDPGLGATMLKRLVEYVRSHRDEFTEK